MRRAGEIVAFDTRKATALLAVLALEGRPRSRDTLCELLWPGRDADHARGALRRTLSVLRRGVGETWIETSGDHVALRDGPGLVVDVRGFRERTTDAATTEELAMAVLAHDGELLEGFSLRDAQSWDAWHRARGDEIREELARALGRLVHRLAEAGSYPEAIPHARRRLGLEPLHEPAHRDLIRLLALHGDRAAALGQYRDCVRTLSEELGVAPLDETAALFEQVSEGTVPGAVEAPPSPVPPRRRLPEEFPLVGRDRELAAVLAAHRDASREGRVVFVEGEPGIGKSRLLRETIAAAEDRGAVVLATGCHDDEAGLPYGPVIELLAEALRRATDAVSRVDPQRLADASLLLPGLASDVTGLPPPVATDAPAARSRLLEGVCGVLAAAATRATVPEVIAVDDAHAADEATLDVLSYLARRLEGRPVLLLFAWRTEGLPPAHRLHRLATELTRAGVASVHRLGRLGPDEVTALVATAAPGAPADLARRVHAESEGLPLFAAEFLRTMDGPEPDRIGALGGELRELMRTRLAGLSPVARQLLETVAVLGRAFDVDTVRRAGGRGEAEAVAGLEELVSSGLVREVPGTRPAYDFTHQKLRAVAYDDLGRARRQLLHRRAAGAVLRGGGDPSLVAQHLRLSGDSRGAAEQHRRAADHAAGVLAFPEALEHLDAALSLGGKGVDVAALNERSGDLQTLLGDYASALRSYETAATHTRNGPTLARLEHKLGSVHQRRGEWKRAEARFALALEVLGDADRGLRSRILADASLTTLRRGDRVRAERLAMRALREAKAATDALAQAQAHNLLGVLARARGDLDMAREALQGSLELSTGPGATAARTAALNNLALVARESGELDLAVDLTADARAQCAADGDRHHEAALENNLAELHRAAGRPDAAMAHRRRAITLFGEIGGDEADRVPALGRLGSW